MTTVNEATAGKTSIWPLVFSPVIAFAYYDVVRSSFLRALPGLVGGEEGSLLATVDWLERAWGTHFIIRLIAEASGLFLGVFIASVLARGREKAAAFVGASLISLYFLARITVVVFFQKSIVLEEPWYQYVIDGLLIFAPFLVAYLSHLPAAENNRQSSQFFGMNPFHVMWLWFPLSLNLPVLLGPFFDWMRHDGLSGMLVFFVVHLIPVIAVWLPAYFGLGFLTGDRGGNLSSFKRQTFGSIVLLLGAVAAFILSGYWYLLLGIFRDWMLS